MRSNPNQTEQNLLDAIARNSAIVLSLPSAGIVRNIKTRFLADSDDGIWVEIEPDVTLLTQELIERQHQLAISFKSSGKRLTFLTTPLQVNQSYEMNAESTVPALRVVWPDEIKGIQRRSAYRVPVGASCELRIKMWAIAEHVALRDRAMASQEVKATLRNLSVGGMGCVFVSEEKTDRLVAQQRLRIELKYNEEAPLLLDARLRSPPKPWADGSLMGGISFKKLEGDIEGRQKLATLTRIVGDLQREEVRRTRIGLAS